jgi:hypothetical protein
MDRAAKALMAAYEKVAVIKTILLDIIFAGTVLGYVV